MKKFRIVTNHTGACDGHHYQIGKETIVSENVVKALGSNAKVLEEIKEKEEPKEEKVEEKEKPEVKEAKKPLDKMVRKEQIVTK